MLGVCVGNVCMQEDSGEVCEWEREGMCEGCVCGERRDAYCNISQTALLTASENTSV